MPKERRDSWEYSSSDDQDMVYPYCCSTKSLDPNNGDNPFPDAGDEKQWEEAQCPICMEHPHNAVLLRCSSREKGCRPFICDTSYRHSYCLTQLQRSATAPSAQSSPTEQQTELTCPLCRGVITGWDVVQPARRFMNSKTRTCALETCDISGNYYELRKHARHDHPSGRPSEVSPTRQSNWERLEREIDSEDAFAQQSDFEYDFDGWPSFDVWVHTWFDERVDTWFDEHSLFFSSGISGTEMSDVEHILGDEMYFNRSSMVSLGLFALEDMTGWSNYYDDNGRNTLGLRSSYQRENVPASLRTRSTYPRENGSTISTSRSSYYRQRASGRSRTNSSSRRVFQPRSRARPR